MDGDNDRRKPGVTRSGEATKDRSSSTYIAVECNKNFILKVHCSYCYNMNGHKRGINYDNTYMARDRTNRKEI
jgi:hypothetical protein